VRGHEQLSSDHLLYDGRHETMKRCETWDPMRTPVAALVTARSRRAAPRLVACLLTIIAKVKQKAAN